MPIRRITVSWNDKKDSHAIPNAKDGLLQKQKTILQQLYHTILTLKMDFVNG